MFTLSIPMKTILKIGHRGAKGHAAENTLASFGKALDMGVNGIELDVHLSSDNVIVVIHDATIDRTTNGKGFVNALSLQELKKLRIENELQIPTLSEVFDFIAQKCFINVELKSDGTAKPVVELIRKYISENGWRYIDFVVSGFDWNALQEVNRLDPNIQIGVLTATDIELAFGFAKFIGAYSIHPYFHLLTAENTMRMQEEGLLVFPWTINETEDIAKIKSFYVNGIITDFPDRL